MSDAKPKRSFFGGFRIRDRESCARAIKNGGIAGLISAGLTGTLAAIGLFTKSSDNLFNNFLDPWSLVDAVFIATLAYFVFRKSRVASTLLVVYFVIAKAVTWIAYGKVIGLPGSIIFFLFYFTAMRATYRWHKLYKASVIEPPQAQA